MISTAEEIDTAKRAASALVAGLIGELTRIGGGRNSQVYRVDGPNRAPFVMKLYFRDERNRRATEYDGLRFLWNDGIRRIPEPLATDESLGASLFRFVEGSPVAAAAATEEDIDTSADFLLKLRDLVHNEGAEKLPLASEAMFSLDALVDNIRRRFLRLREVAGKSSPYAEMQGFIRWEFERSFESLADWSAGMLRERGLSPSEELPREMRTLSPSDFGFHNALRTESGLVFVDFEYFGWDDPAKMISDFLLHPGMPLAKSLRGRFLRRILRGTGSEHALDARARIGYAMYGLKWCMILLNEFVPEHLERRLFNDPNLRVEEHQREQLAKARTMLSQARAAREAFPYEEWIGP